MTRGGRPADSRAEMGTVWKCEPREFITPSLSLPINAGVFPDDRPGGAEAIDGRGDDPAGEAGPLADRVQARHARRLAGLRIAVDPHRRAAPRLRAGEHRVRHELPVPAAVHLR